MKRFLMIIAVTCAMGFQTLAGEIPSGGLPAPMPSGEAQGAISSDPGQIPTDGVTDPISDAALSALLTVIGLLSA